MKNTEKEKDKKITRTGGEHAGTMDLKTKIKLAAWSTKKRQAITVAVVSALILGTVGTVGALSGQRVDNPNSKAPSVTENSENKEKDKKGVKGAAVITDNKEEASAENPEKTTSAKSETKKDEKNKETSTTSEKNEKTSSTSSTNTAPKSSSGNTGSKGVAGGSANSTSTGTSSNTGKTSSGSTSSSSKPSSGSSSQSAPVHTHQWIAQYKTVHHEATGHNETQPVYEKRYVAKKDGKPFTDEDECIDYCAFIGSSYTYTSVQTGTKTVYVQDKPAWDEQVLTGYRCSCGATK